MSKQEIKIKGVMEKDSVFSRLEEIILCMREGRINIQSEEDGISLTPGKSIKMEIKAESGKEKQKIEIELSWHTDKESELRPVEMTINCKEPGQGISENNQTGTDHQKAPAVSGPAIESRGESKEPEQL